MLQTWQSTSKGQEVTDYHLLKLTILQLIAITILIIISITGPARYLQKKHRNPTKGLKKLKWWHCQGDHLKNDFPTVPHQSKQVNHCILSFKLIKKKQHKLIRSFQKRFQNKKEPVNKITTAAEDDSSNDQLNQFFSEF